MSIAAQALQVRKVKRSQSGMILDPITLNVESTARDAENIMRENKIGGIPVVDANKKLVGIVTNRDMRFIKDMSTPVNDIMTKDFVLRRGNMKPGIYFVELRGSKIYREKLVIE